MKRLSFLLFLYLLLTLPCMSETLLGSHYGAHSGREVEILAAYQIGDEIWVSSWIKSSNTGVVMNAAGYHYATESAYLPSIVAMDMGNVSVYGSEKIIYIGGKQIRDFNYSAGDGWVDSPSVGWIFIRSYPWVYHCELGWLYVVEDVIVSGPCPCGEVTSWLGGKKYLSFKLYSPTYGWLWANPYEEKVFVYELGTYVSIDELSI